MNHQSTELTDAISQFNNAAMKLAATEFPRPQTPGQWKVAYEQRWHRDLDSLIEAVLTFLGVWKTADQGHRFAARRTLTADAAYLLSHFAYYAAVLAVRRRSPALLESGLIALTVIGERQDARDLTFSVAALFHSAHKLGMSEPQLFAEVGSMADCDAIGEIISTFPQRPRESRQLKAFWMREVKTDGEYDLISRHE